ncbi:MAG TPA: amino acid ABC transporter ATP-binding protein [Xanthobacteraceae bacterium]
MGSIIEVDRLSKRFGKTDVLRSLSFSVSAKEVVSVIGPSGSGKTTLLRCLAMLESPTEGEIRLRGVPVAKASHTVELRRNARAVRADIGMVFQHFNLWPHKTVLGNIIEAPMLVKGLSRAEAVAGAERLLAKVGLSEKRDVYPARLSGGQQQRVAIARALAMKPALILFDEPTSALDPEVTGEVLSVMEEIAYIGMTMIVVTHEMGFARNAANRVAFMADGQIVEIGAPDEFFTRPRTDRARDFLSKILTH